MMVYTLLGTVLITSYLLLSRYINLPHDANEPPLIPSRIPFIGHVIGAKG